MATQLQPLQTGREAEALKSLTAVDGSLLPALPKMAWALWNYEQFRLFQAILDGGSSFVCCVREQMTWKVIEERPLCEAARKAGVVFDAVVDLGAEKAKGVLKQPLRVVQIDIGRRDAHGQPIYQTRVTDRRELDAEPIALAYRYRWQIELFFAG